MNYVQHDYHGIGVVRADYFDGHNDYVLVVEFFRKNGFVTEVVPALDCDEPTDKAVKKALGNTEEAA